MDGRLRALCDLAVSGVRENAGRHEYDGRIQDLSPEGVKAGLDRLGGDPLPDPYDEAHLSTFEALARLELGELQLHRRNPLLHVAELDLSCYDRDYAPAGERVEARRRHLAAWPDGVDAALASLDAVPAPVAVALAPAARGLAAGLDPADPVEAAALAAHERLVAHLEQAATSGPPDPALGAHALERLLATGEALPVDLGRLEERADAERDRLRVMLAEALGRYAPGRPVGEVVDGLLRDHPDAEGVLAEAREVTAESIRFTAERRIVPDLDGECVVGPAPPSRRWALAMMSWAAPFEPDAPSRYYITPPEPSWPADQQEDWLAVFSRTTLPAITVHEVAPGHFAHGRSLRRADGEVRRTLHSAAFVEGWAHYAEEVCLEEGFRADDPRFAAGVALEALQRVTRLAVSVGVHGGTMTMDEAVHRFETDAFAHGPAAVAEATRATYDPTYGRYTWGKLELLRLREAAREAWGAGFSLERFHGALLALGAPPLGLAAHALDGHEPATGGPGLK
ncbi:MAG TPA: DUF885 family protein [Actinomycetota bacterium]|nr:DUF885 family protein [Actinomycetota bacterium]